MSKHCWQRIEDNTKKLECMKCGARQPLGLILWLREYQALGVQKKECPGMRQSFRRALRRHVRTHQH